MICVECKEEMEFVDEQGDFLSDSPYYYCSKCDRTIYLDELPDDHPDRHPR